MSQLKNKFDLLIKQSLKYQKHILNDGVYYDEMYLEELKKILEERDLIKAFSRELILYKNDVRCKMTSVASSSRLCFLYFQADKRFGFEKEVRSGLSGYSPTLDAFLKKDKLYYECKCHEIIDNHDKTKDKLKPSYRRLLKKYFSLDISNQYNGRLMVMLDDFGIDDDRSIYQLHFDFKQLLCHLFGIANNNGGTLKYIFFTPKEAVINENQDISNVYEELNAEIEMIWHNSAIVEFCKEYNINLARPKFISVDKINDIVAKRLS